jgi:stress-induced morphogen
MYCEIINDGSQIHTKHINILCVQNLEIFNIRLLVPLGFKGLKLSYKNQLVNAVLRNNYYCFSVPHKTHK